MSNDIRISRGRVSIEITEEGRKALLDDLQYMVDTLTVIDGSVNWSRLSNLAKLQSALFNVRKTGYTVVSGGSDTGY